MGWPGADSLSADRCRARIRTEYTNCPRQGAPLASCPPGAVPRHEGGMPGVLGEAVGTASSIRS